jgi:hypothetical protein
MRCLTPLGAKKSDLEPGGGATSFLHIYFCREFKYNSILYENQSGCVSGSPSTPRCMGQQNINHFHNCNIGFCLSYCTATHNVLYPDHPEVTSSTILHRERENNIFGSTLHDCSSAPSTSSISLLTLSSWLIFLKVKRASLTISNIVKKGVAHLTHLAIASCHQYVFLTMALICCLLFLFNHVFHILAIMTYTSLLY